MLARALGVLTVVAMVCAGCSNDSGGTDARSSGSPSPSGPVLSLVVIGDSIPYNSPDDCPDCTGFVARYAAALAHASGRKVDTTNLSQHNGLTLPMLMDELESFRTWLSKADAIIVGIAHNSFGLNADRPCGTTFDEATSTLEDWSKVDRHCARISAARYRSLYDQLFTTVASWRSGKPTILRAIDKYNDWNGWADAHLTRSQVRKTVMMHDMWNAMLCGSARAHGFTCADVYHAFNGPDGSKPSGALLGQDYTHPSEQGNQVIADQLIGEGFAPIA